MALNNWLFLSSPWIGWAQLGDSSAPWGVSRGDTELVWGGNIHRDFTHWCLSWGVRKKLGHWLELSLQQASPSGFQDGFIPSLITCLDVWLCHQCLLPIQVQIPHCAEVVIPKSKCLHVLNITISSLELLLHWACTSIKPTHCTIICVFMHLWRIVSCSSLHAQGLTLPDLKQLFSTCLKNELLTNKPYLKHILDEKLPFFFFFKSLTVKRDLCPTTTKSLKFSNAWSNVSSLFFSFLWRNIY